VGFESKAPGFVNEAPKLLLEINLEILQKKEARLKLEG
jgi:hypothetical protein